MITNSLTYDAKDISQDKGNESLLAEQAIERLVLNYDN
jgi:hypothetical protein